MFEAVHDRIQQRVAIKVLHKEMSSDDKGSALLQLKHKAISLAQHSSIVKIMDWRAARRRDCLSSDEFPGGEAAAPA